MKVWWIFSFLSSVCFIKKAVLKLVCVPETQEKDVGKKADFFFRYFIYLHAHV